MSMAFIDTESGGGDTGVSRVETQPATTRKETGRREITRDGRRILVIEYDDQTTEEQDLGPVKPPDKTVKSREEIVRNGRKILVITYSDETTEEQDLGPVETTTVTTGPRFYGTNPELLSQLQTQLGILQAITDPRAVNLVGYGEAAVQGFIEGRYSFEGVFGSLTDLLGKARAATGTTETSSTTTQTGTEDTSAAFRAQQRSDAFSRVRSLLTRFGLSELEGAVQNILTSGAVDLTDPNAIIFAIRGEPAYKRRFAGNEARVKRGLPELDAATYIGLEEQYRNLMRSNGLPVGFYDQANDFQRLIEGDVSPQELQERIEQGYRKVRDADPEVKRQMRELYGVDDNALTAYFLDPDKAAPLLTRQARAAQISARGREQAGLQLTAESAEALAARGITPEEAQQRFTERAQLAGLYQPLAGEEALTPEQELGAAFGYDVAAQQALTRRRAQRVGEFQAGGGFARTTGKTSGTVETGLGGPQ